MLASAIDRIAAYKFQDVSVGKSLLYFLGLEFGNVFTSALKKFKVPALATGAVAAYAVRRVGAIRRFFGDVGSDVVSITMLAAGADEQFELSKKVDRALAKAAVSVGLMDWQEAVHKGFFSIKEAAEMLGMKDTEAYAKYREWEEKQREGTESVSSPEIGAPELSTGAEVGNPAAEIASPNTEDLGGVEEYLTSVERKIKAIAQK